MTDHLSSPRPPTRRFAIFVGVLSALAACPPDALAARVGTPLARVSLVGGGVERGASGQWSAMQNGDILRVGDRLRTDVSSTVRLSFPWTTVILSPSSVMYVPATAVLVLNLESGRIEQSSKGADVIKINAGSALVRGAGQVVVRRMTDTTTVTARLGRFRVQTRKGTLDLSGAAALIPDGEKAALHAFPAAPVIVAPGMDPVYVTRDSRLELSWRPAKSESTFHVEVVAIGADDAVLHAESTTPSVSVQTPWPGTFRWRAYAVDEQGIEGAPSRYGFFCVPGF